MNERKRARLVAASFLFVTLFGIDAYSDSITAASVFNNAKNDIVATAMMEQTPENIWRDWSSLPENVRNNSVQLILYFGKVENSEDGDYFVKGGSGMLVEQTSGYDVYLTAAHIILNNNDPISAISVQHPFNNPAITYQEDTIFTFLDKTKDMGIIIIKNSESKKTSKIPVSNNWIPSVGDKLYGITYPQTGIIAPGFVVYEPRIIDSFSNNNLISLEPGNYFGGSGSVMCDSQGNIDSVLTEVGSTFGVDNPTSIVVKVGNTLDNLLKEASGQLAINF